MFSINTIALCANEAAKKGIVSDSSIRVSVSLSHNAITKKPTDQKSM